MFKKLFYEEPYKYAITEELMPVRINPMRIMLVNNELAFVYFNVQKEAHIITVNRIEGILHFDYRIVSNDEVIYRKVLDTTFMTVLGFSISDFGKEIRVSKGFYSLKITKDKNELQKVALYKNRECDVDVFLF